jgi:hypothetical protein
MAFKDKNTDVSKAMLDSLNKIIRPQDEYKADSIKDADRLKADKLLAQIIGEEVEKPVQFPGTDLADMNASVLLYAATKMKESSLSMEAKQRVTQDLANSEHPALYTFFLNIVGSTEDAKLKKIAGKGLSRIIKNANIDDNGSILISQ